MNHVLELDYSRIAIGRPIAAIVTPIVQPRPKLPKVESALEVVADPLDAAAPVELVVVPRTAEAEAPPAAAAVLEAIPRVAELAAEAEADATATGVVTAPESRPPIGLLALYGVTEEA